MEPIVLPRWLVLLVWVMLPLWASTIERQMASPSPSPSMGRVVSLIRSNGSNMRVRSVSGMPLP